MVEEEEEEEEAEGTADHFVGISPRFHCSYTRVAWAMYTRVRSVQTQKRRAL